MKTLYVFLLAALISMESQAQELDQSITKIAEDFAQKIAKKNRVKLALTDFVNSEGKTDALTDYIREELEAKLINAPADLQVIDRKHIKLLLSEHHLQSQGLIDESTAKSAISFIKVDGWILAEITTLGEQVKIKVSAIDVSTSQIFAASSSGLITDKAIKELLDPEIKLCTECGGKGVVQFQLTCTSCEGKGSFICSVCGGAGKRDGAFRGSYISCESCNGTGKVICKACSGSGKAISYKTCPKCNGKVQLPTDNQPGRARLQLCVACNGNGKFTVQVSCEKCGGSGEAPFGPSSNWERKACRSCSGKGQITSLKICSKCNGTGRL